MEMIMFRSFALASAAALSLAAPAFAQPADTGAFTWTGPYVGINAGYGGGGFNYPFSGTTDAAGTNPVAGRLRQDSSGPLGGGQIGYNVQGPQGLVFGLETDIDAANIRGRSDFHSADASGTFTSGGVDSKIDYLGTLRGRIGAPLFNGRFLPYVTGGFAYGGVRNSAGFGCSGCSNGGGFTSDTHTQTGWTVGAGTEYALDRHLSFKVEYLYADLGGRDLSSDLGGTFSAPGVSLSNASVRENTDANLIRAGLNFRF
jgi:outer membrane immunogenic protein